MGGDYKDSLNLPSTDFPMRANLADREPDQIERWDDEDVYERMIRQRKEEDAPRFVFHDGPPYANGHIHHGHILNKALKDFVVKFRNMDGELCEFVHGWDCHGLPIEHEVDEQLGDDKKEMSKAEIRQECREYADEFVDIQRDEFKRIMAFGDWDDPYRTMSYDYEATIVRMLGEFFESDLVYRGLKPVHWDWESETALAEAEVEYESFKTEQVYVTFPFPDAPDELAEAAGDRDVSVLIWTTTPWTLPANQAIALHPDLTYQLVDVDGEALVMAEGLRDEVFEDCDVDDYEVLTEFEGRLLVGEMGEGRGYAAEHPWMDRESVLLPAHYVTLDQGTGCVHTAPGHGQEDFALGQQFDLDVLCPVDEQALFREDLSVQVGDDEWVDLEGMHVLTANAHISESLDYIGHLLNEPNDRITIERYPYGWRSNKPVIFRATTQWFVALEPETVGDSDGFRLRDEALEAIDQVDWIPDWGHDRIEGMVQSRPDWCISRQRTWGAPITALYCDRDDCDGAVASKELADHVADIVDEHGADVWFEWDLDELVPESTECPECGGTNFEREEDILDVWFDSGVSWAAVLEEKLGIEQPADLYLEGSDQHRGWFQSSLLTGVLTRGRSPYETCLTHGFVTDEDGHKYSKSSQNFEPPEEMISDFGAETLRLWVSSVDYSNDVALSPEILDRTADAYRKIRNTFRFMLGNLSDFDPETQLDYDELHEIDQWILHRTAETVDRIREGYETYEFHEVYHALVEFATVDLSNVYMNILKDRLYCEAPSSKARRSGQTAYWLVLSALARAAAPILSFTSEEVWSHLPTRSSAPDSVFLADFPEVPEAWRDEQLDHRWSRLLDIRKEVQKALETKREADVIGDSQEAHVTLTADGPTLELLEEYDDQLVEFFIVSGVDLEDGSVDGEALVDCDVEPAEGEKCPRCWNFWVDPDGDDDVCQRCRQVVEQVS